MTFIPSSRSDPESSLFRPRAIPHRSAMSTRRKLSSDEDGARKALGTDQQFPIAIVPGASLENLARIALG